MADKTPPKQLAQFAWKPGQSGNPAGRPLGSRSKLGEQFIADMYEDWQSHGREVIEAVRRDKPDQYLKVLASILPKEVHVTDMSLEDMSDDELIDILAALRAAGTGGKENKRRGRAPKDLATPREPGRLN